MLRYPALKAHLSVGAVPGEGMILLPEDGSWTLQGTLFEQVLPLLDGARTPEEIAAAQVPLKPLDVYYALEFLEKQGHLAEKAPGLDGPVEAFWASLGLDPGSARAGLRSGGVRVRTAGSVDPAPLIRCLEEAGLVLATGEPRLEVVLTDDYLRVDLASAGQNYFTELLAHYDGLERDLWVLDLTHDLGIAVFAALSCRRETKGQVLFGLGCSLDPSVALLRACAELNQFVSGIGPKVQAPLGNEETLRWLRTATLDNQPHLAPDPCRPVRQLADFPNAASGDLLADIQFGQALVEARGMEMLVLDLTRADAGMPVAKVIVPVLGHYAAGCHALERWPDSPAAGRMLLQAAAAMGSESAPDILFTLAARIQRVTWKYQTIGYSLILKNTGVLYQQMYLVATALGLAPCAIGAGDIQLFAQASGLDATREASVGEFALSGGQPT